MESKGIREVPGAKIVADFSVYINSNQENALYAGITTEIPSFISFYPIFMLKYCF